MKNKAILSIVLLIFILANKINAQPDAEQDLTFEEFSRKLNETNDPQILDVRSTEEFRENHLIGAINLPARDTVNLERNISKLDKSKPVFVYSINNGRSSSVAGKLKTKGFQQVYKMPGGIAHWLGAGKPVKSSLQEGLTDDEFNALLKSDNVVLVSVGSKYCGSCRKVAPIVEQIRKEQAGLISVVKVELYENREIANSLQIEAVPTVILYKGAKPIWRKSGAMEKNEVQDALDNSL